MVANQKYLIFDLLPAQIVVIIKEYANAHNPLGSENTTQFGSVELE